MALEIPVWPSLEDVSGKECQEEKIKTTSIQKQIMYLHKFGQELQDASEHGS